MRPHSRYSVDARSPRARGNCDRCNFTYQHDQLKWQYQWTGNQLQNLRILVCEDCLDTPQEQLRAIILPPDPVPILNPRPEDYENEVNSYLTTANSSGVLVTSPSSNPLVTEIKITPTPTSSGYTYDG